MKEPTQKNISLKSIMEVDVSSDGQAQNATFIKKSESQHRPTQVPEQTEQEKQARVDILSRRGEAYFIQSKALTMGEPQQPLYQQREMSKLEDDLLYGLGKTMAKAQSKRLEAEVLESYKQTHVINETRPDESDYLRKKAVESYKEAFAINPANAGVKSSLVNIATEYYKLAQHYIGQNQIIKGLAYYKQCVDIIIHMIVSTMDSSTDEQLKEDMVCCRSLTEDYSKMGAVYYKKEDYANSLGCYQLALTLNEVSCYQLALALDEVGFDFVGKQYSDMANTCYNIGEVYCAQGHTTQGLEYFQRALAIYQKTLDEPNITQTKIAIENCRTETSGTTLLGASRNNFGFPSLTGIGIAGTCIALGGGMTCLLPLVASGAMTASASLLADEESHQSLSQASKHSLEGRCIDKLQRKSYDTALTDANTKDLCDEEPAATQTTPMITIPSSVKKGVNHLDINVTTNELAAVQPASASSLQQVDSHRIDNISTAASSKYVGSGDAGFEEKTMDSSAGIFTGHGTITLTCSSAVQDNGVGILQCDNQHYSVSVFPKTAESAITTINHPASSNINGDSYHPANCVPVEFNGQPVVACEGESTSLIYQPRFQTPYQYGGVPLPSLSDTLILGQVILHWGRGIYSWLRSRSDSDEPSEQSQFTTIQQRDLIPQQGKQQFIANLQEPMISGDALTKRLDSIEQQLTTSDKWLLSSTTNHFTNVPSGWDEEIVETHKGRLNTLRQQLQVTETELEGFQADISHSGKYLVDGRHIISSNKQPQQLDTKQSLFSSFCRSNFGQNGLSFFASSSSPFSNRNTSVETVSQQPSTSTTMQTFSKR